MEMILYRDGEPFTVLYDDCDNELVSGRLWRINKGGYAVAWIREMKRKTSMHRLIIKAIWMDTVDHVNRITTDNRRCNLRLCSRGENSRNRRSSGETSKYLGVHRVSKSSFAANIFSEGKSRYLGAFKDEEEAARAYDKAARELHGEFANPNFPA